MQAGRCAAHLSVERRIAIDEINGEAEFRGEEVDGCLEVANVQMCGHRGENRPGVGMRLGHGNQSSCSQRLPSCKALFARNKFLRVSQAKSRRQNFLIGEVTEPGQEFPDHGGDGIIPLAMPSQILHGLFSEVFEVRHRRNERLCCVGGPLPFRPAPMRPTPQIKILPPRAELSTRSPRLTTRHVLTKAFDPDMLWRSLVK